MNSLAAADYLLITLQCEYMALEGLGQILRNVERLKTAGINPALELGGIVMTMFDVRTSLSRQVVDEVKTHMPDKIFTTVIPRTVRLSEAPSFGKTIFAYDPLEPRLHRLPQPRRRGHRPFRAYDRSTRQAFVVGLQSNLVYRWNFAVRSIFWFFHLARRVHPLGRRLRREAPTIGGFTFAQTLTYFVVIFVLQFFVGAFNEDYQISEDIRNGLINQFLLKPINYFAYRLSVFAAARVVSGAFGILALLRRPALLPGLPRASPRRVADRPRRPGDGAHGGHPVQHRVLLRPPGVLVPRDPGLRHPLDGRRDPSSAARSSRWTSCPTASSTSSASSPSSTRRTFPRPSSRAGRASTSPCRGWPSRRPGPSCWCAWRSSSGGAACATTPRRAAEPGAHERTLTLPPHLACERPLLAHPRDDVPRRPVRLVAGRAGVDIGQRRSLWP